MATAEQSLYNLRTAQTRVAARLGIADPRSISFEVRKEYNRALAEEILRYPQSFDATALANARASLEKDFGSIVDTGFDLTAFADAVADEAAETLPNVGNKLLLAAVVVAVAYVVVKALALGAGLRGVNSDSLAHLGIGAGGTTFAAIFAPYAPDAAFMAGVLTSAWMARQLWLSFKRRKSDGAPFAASSAVGLLALAGGSMTALLAIFGGLPWGSLLGFVATYFQRKQEMEREERAHLRAVEFAKLEAENRKAAAEWAGFTAAQNASASEDSEGVWLWVRSLRFGMRSFLTALLVLSAVVMALRSDSGDLPLRVMFFAEIAVGFWFGSRSTFPGRR